MSCPRCSFVNPDGFRFCGQCGTALTPAPVAGPTARPAPADTERAVPHGERKQVTVLFADVKGSMDLAERVDAEAWHRIIDRFFVILADGVHRFDGTVTQYTGDGIMAIFGAPIAQEDHAQRACHAALHLRDHLRRHALQLQREQQLQLAVRIGLNSGEVVVGRVGDDLHMEYTAIGHTVGLAARMEQLAEPGTIYLSDHTARLVLGLFTVSDLGPLPIKGVSQPLRSYRLDGIGALRSRLDVARSRGFSRFVGRDAEWRLLEAALGQAHHSRGRVVGIVAEAGVGKSRLCHEFAQHCRAQGLTVHEVQAVAHGRMLPFLPLLGLLRRLFRVDEHDGAAEVREKIAGVLVLIDQRFHSALPFWFDFFGVPDPAWTAPPLDAGERQQQLRAVLEALIRTRSSGGKAVLIADDMQWLDAASETVLSDLVAALATTSTLVLLNFRPEYIAPYQGKPYYEQLPLAPLGADAVDALLDSLLGTAPALAELRRLIRERTLGNPFFIEEVVRTLYDDGVLASDGDAADPKLARPVTTIEIPPTVQAVLAARIDHLPDTARHMLQTAAVIGKSFSVAVLWRVLALTENASTTASPGWAALGLLEEADFIVVEDERNDGEVQYAFKHPLTHEVAYHSQLTSRRTQVHAAVARAIAERHPDTLDRQAALLAYHWERANMPLDAARWHRRAAEWVSLTNFPQSVRHWRQVKALTDTLPASGERTELGILARAEILTVGARLGSSDEERATLLEELQALSGDADHGPRARAIVQYGSAAMQVMQGDADAAIPTLRGKIADAQRGDDQGLILALQSALALAYLYTGRLREALAVTEGVVASPPRDTTLGCNLVGSSPYVLSLLVRSIVLREVGRPTDAQRAIEQGIELAHRHGESEPLTLLHLSHVDLARVTGEVEPALEHARQALAAAEKLNSPFSRNQAYSAISHAHMLRGEWTEAVPAAEQSLAIVRETRFGLSDEAFRLAALADAHLHCKSIALARSLYEQAIALAQQRRNRLAESYAHVGLARTLATETGAAPAAVETALDNAEALVAQTGGIALLPVIRFERAMLAHRSGDAAAAQRNWREARQMFLDMGARKYAEQIAALLDSPAVD